MIRKIAAVIIAAVINSCAPVCADPIFNSVLGSDKGDFRPSNPNAPGSGVRIHSSNKNSDNRNWLSFINAYNRKYDVQPLLATGQTSAWLVPGSGSTIHVIGAIASVSGGSGNTRNATNTSIATAQRRVGIVGSTSNAGSAVSVRWAHPTHTIGNSSFKTGFIFSIKIAMSDGNAPGQGFEGFLSTGSAQTDTNPSTLTNAIGLCQLPNNANMHICYGGSSAQTPIDLGANFPANTITTDLYEFSLYAPANGTVLYRVRRINTGDEAFDVLDGTLGTQLPDYNTLLAIHAYRGNGGQAVTPSFELYEMTLQNFF